MADDRMEHINHEFEEKGRFAVKEPVITEECAEVDEQETTEATRYNIFDGIIDVIIAILPIYFIVFAILGYVRNGTTANSLINMALLDMARFVKSNSIPYCLHFDRCKVHQGMDNPPTRKRSNCWLEIEHLLGSRSLVSSVLTPVRLKTVSYLVPILVIFWACNPIGGQTSLRVVTKSPEETTVDAPFHYFDLSRATPIGLECNTCYLTTRIVTNSAFNNALMNPATAKNGTQDIYGNLQVPLLEDLKTRQIPGADGWYDMVKLPENWKEAAEDVLDVLTGGLESLPRIEDPIYVALTGLPFSRGSVTDGVQRQSSNELASLILQELLGGPTVVGVESFFTMETSYFYADCDVRRIESNATNERMSTLPNDVSYITSGQRLSLSIDSGIESSFDGHTYNSTRPRRVAMEIWGSPIEPDYTMNEVTKAQCNLTTTYVEASVYCPAGNNCSITAMRESQRQHPSSMLSALDGITLPRNGQDQVVYDGQAVSIAPQFFTAFINSTGESSDITAGYERRPLEYYFVDPVHPFNGLGFDASVQPLYAIGNKVFSQRFTQLLNTYWLDHVAPFDMTGSFNPLSNDTIQSQITGKARITEMVLECHTVYMVIVIIISAVLVAVGFITAYLDITRRGPDVLDNFVNSLRYSPYIHVPHGPSLEDGKEKAKRLRRTVVRMGDVKPDSPVGFVAIATPSEGQPVARIQPKRQYS
ncbi:hypothetical protein HII31_07641 [Pseudocercospora fuligena]|uniref:Uncharacterized protein n=1 Tax=Pseudocercospora fuligena TaxID=685502 RepID=A0A8H6RI52_9PEZI|nr:hypothetical protein HII31_07641 [Pseudocercospora fuligena]